MLPAAFSQRYAAIAPSGSLAWLGQPLPKTFRVNTLKADAATALEELAAEGVHAERAPWHPDAFIAPSLDKHALGSTLAHFLGHIYVQDLASLLPVMALEPELKQPLLDACAAPGSKTTQLAAALRNAGCIVANDRAYHRLKALKSNLERLGVCNTVLTNHDFRAFPSMEFRCILLDAPCSGEGLRTSAGAQFPHRIPALASLQRQLLAKAFSLLAPGGCVLYSTCTLAPEENELVVASLLAQADARLEPIELQDVPLASGITYWNGAIPAALRNARRLWPGPAWGGFFLAKIRKVG